MDSNKVENKGVVLAADGTENSEHVFDMIERFEMTYGKIQKDSFDEDELDAMQLMCQDCIDIEAKANELINDIEILKERINKKIKVKESEVEELLKQILILELHSKEIVEKIIKNN